MSLIKQALGCRNPIATDKRYSAALTYKAAVRAGLPRRMAYLCAVTRYGWPRESRWAAAACSGWSLATEFLKHP